MLVRFFLSLALSAVAYAQVTAFPRAAYFREAFSKPVTKVELRPPVRLEDFVVEGKLELSLRSYLELVMANNTDLAIQRLTVELAQNNITRQFAPFDPAIFARFTSTRSKTPANDVLSGASTLNTLAQPATFQYQQTMQSGTQYNVNFFGQKFSTNNAFQNFNPALNSNLGINFIQPLLRNRGGYVNRLPIMAARSRLRATEYNLADTVLKIVTDAENAYWDVVFFQENVRVQEAALDLAGQALKRAQRELELGAMSPLDIYQPQQQYAQAQIQVSQFRYFLMQREDALRRQIGADLDPTVRKLPIVLTESPAAPPETVPIDGEREVERAVSLRPDLKAAVQALDIDDLNMRSAKNAMLPDLALIGGYTSQGRGGPLYERTHVFGDPGRSNIVRVIPGGFNDALDQLFGFGFPIYQFGVQLRLPVRNRAAAADLADAQVLKKRDSLQVRNTQQAIRLDVLTAVNEVESSKASIKLAVVARDFAQKRLDAEQKKYELGTSQIFFVLQAQNDLINAESAVVRESINYRRNQLNLLRRTGELLEERGVIVP